MKTLIPLLILLFSFQTSFANGGPIVNSMISKSGNVVLIKNKEIYIAKEELNLKIESDYSIYEVIYTFNINSAFGFTKDTIHYGFPIDFLNEEYNSLGIARIKEGNPIEYFEMYLGENKLVTIENDGCRIDSGFNWCFK